MTKGELVALLPNVTTQEEAKQLASAFAALDVCTPAEREFLSAYFEWWHVEPPTAEQVTRLEKARSALIAERTPPDPVEEFIARMRTAVCKQGGEVEEAFFSALFALDAARGKR